MAQRNIIRDGASDFLARRFAEIGIRALPKDWINIAASALPRSVRDSDDVQEAVGQGLGILSALAFGLDHGSQAALEGAIEEALEEIGKNAELHPAGPARKSYVRTRLEKVEADFKKRLEEGETGMSMAACVAWLSFDDQQKWLDWFYGLSPDGREERRKEMGLRVGEGERLRLILNINDSKHRIEELDAYLKEAPLIKEPDKGFLDKVLSFFGGNAADLAPDGTHVTGYRDSVRRSSQRLDEETDLLDKLGY